MNILITLSNYIHIEVALVALASFFFFAVVGIVYRWLKIRTELKKALSTAKQIIGNTQTVDAELYDSLSTELRLIPIIDHAWSEFDETVIRDDSEEKVQIFNTKSISVFLRKEEILERHLAVSFNRKVPGILTSLGLLFTFLFIVFGLMDVHFEGKQVVGIDRLISGLSAKFQSSVLAIFLATIFTFIEHWAMRATERQYQELIDFLDQRFQHKASEDYLRSIDRNMRELNHSMKRFSTDLAGVIKEGLQDGMRPSTDRLLVAIENLEKQKSENIADTLSKVLLDFKASLNQSAGSEFAELGVNIGKLAIVMNESAERSAAVSSRMDSLVQAMDSQINKQEKMGDTSVARLSESFGQLLVFIEQSSKSQAETMKVMMEEMISRTGSATAGLISNVDLLTERNSKVASGFSSLAENFERNIHQYNESVSATQALIKSTGDVASSVGKSLSEVASLQGKIQSTYNHFTEQTVIVQQIQKENVVSVDKYRVVFKEVESGLETVLRQIGDNLARYSDLTKTGLQGYLDDYDKSLSNATSKLSSTVGDLDEVLENLNDHIESIRKVGRTGTDG
ncbi:MAG: hypothetical protein AB7H97_10220 [Pseudobdellovibrionaceae bacterium]